MKHYLFYIPSFAGGGAERLTVMLANQFNKNGNKVSFVVNVANGPHKSLLTQDVPLHELNSRTNFTAIFLFASLLNRIKPDCIYCSCGLCPIIGVLGALLLAIHSKVVISYHNLYSPNSRIGNRITYYFASLLSRLSGSTICVSSDVQNELINRFRAAPQKLRTIYNPVNLKEVDEKSKEPFPKFLSTYQEEKLFILAVGRFVKQKDFPTLIRAFHNIHRELPHDLLVLGQGPLENDIRALLKELSLEDRVILPGFLPNPFPMFRAASLFVLSSTFEGFGNVIIEALAAGTPVVSTNCPGGPKEILANGKFGPLTPVGNDTVLAEAIILTLKNPLPTEILQERARDFSLDTIARQYQRICENID